MVVITGSSRPPTSASGAGGILGRSRVLWFFWAVLGLILFIFFEEIASARHTARRQGRDSTPGGCQIGYRDRTCCHQVC
jgi:hypothetical protein